MAGKLRLVRSVAAATESAWVEEFCSFELLSVLVVKGFCFPAGAEVRSGRDDGFLPREVMALPFLLDWKSPLRKPRGFLPDLRLLVEGGFFTSVFSLGRSRAFSSSRTHSE